MIKIKEYSRTKRILKYISDNPNCRLIDIKNTFEDNSKEYGEYIPTTTIQRIIKNLDDLDEIDKSENRKTYTINPYIKDISGDLQKQIIDGRNIQIKHKNNHNYIKNSIEKYVHSFIYQNKDSIPIQLSNNIYNSYLEHLYTLISHHFIINPENWYIFQEQKDLRFSIRIEIDLDKDPQFLKALEVIKNIVKQNNPIFKNEKMIYANAKLEQEERIKSNESFIKGKEREKQLRIKAIRRGENVLRLNRAPTEEEIRSLTNITEEERKALLERYKYI